MSVLIRSLGILGTVAVLPLAAAAQQPADSVAPQPPGDVELAMFREVFQYPSFTRRNPFLPLTAAGELRFERLTLLGIMYSPDPTASLAIVSTGGVSLNDDGTLSPVEGEAYNARVGQRIGNTTIREIQRDRVIVDVDEFGLTERRTMLLPSRRPGGSR
jgi:hypothetical protein